MSRLALAVALVIAGASLTACSSAPPSAASPREGRVTLAWSNCATGSCIYDWKVCVGPDLLMHISGDDHWARRSLECTS